MASLARPVRSPLGVLECSRYVLLLLVTLEAPHGLDYIFLFSGCFLVSLQLPFDRLLQTALMVHVVVFVERTIKDDYVVFPRVIAAQGCGPLTFLGSSGDITLT